MAETELTERSDGQASCPNSVSSVFAGRGLAKTVRRDAEEQQARETETRVEAPLAYRLSDMDENGVNAYRTDGEEMTEDGLLRYAGESRAMRVEGKDFSADTAGVYESAEAHALEPAVKKPTALETVRKTGENLKNLPSQTVETVKKRHSLWFDPRKGSTEKEKRRFPLSAFAAVAAVAISMMLIVAGSLMVIGAETQISRLNAEITQLHEDITDLKSDLETSVDLLEIRRIATEEYGMVGEEYLKMDYIALDRDEIAEVKGEKKNSGIGLAGLLSAIGWK
ncbi:MAG TPA: hypothetical protein DDW30_09725 [Clostridiales bacterium]|nr:hypothetical protein [Clostridiales bacterium]